MPVSLLFFILIYAYDKEGSDFFLYTILTESYIKFCKMLFIVWNLNNCESFHFMCVFWFSNIYFMIRQQG